MRRSKILILVALVAMAVSTQITAAEPASLYPRKYGSNKHFLLGVAAGLERFDSNVKVTDKVTGRSVFIDGESSLGLPETEFIPILYGAWQISKRHGMGFNYFRINRTSTLNVIDANWEDLNVTGIASFSDKSSFFYINYSYAFQNTENAVIRGLLGVYAIDLKLDLDAFGDVSIGGEPVTSGEYAENFNQFVPLPLFGLDFWFAASDRWWLGGKFAMIGGKIDNVTALVTEASLRARYRFTGHVGLMIGVNYLSGDVDIDKTNTRREITYGFDGAFLGLDFRF